MPPSVDPLELSVIAPMYMEGGAIADNVRKLLVALDQLQPEGGWELILVNDGSTDDSLGRAREAARGRTEVRFFTYPANRGRGYALKTGLAGCRGRYIVTTESDLSWGPGIVKALYDELKRGEADIVLASPHRSGGRLENVPLHRVLLSRWGNRILTTALGGRLTMVTGMTRGYRREVWECLDIESDRKEFHLEVISKAQAMGYHISEIPAVLAWEPPGPGGPKRVSKFPMMRFIVSHLAFSFNAKPLLLFGLGGLGFLLCGLAAGAYVTVLRFTGELNPARPLVTLVVLLVVTGLLFMAFGFIAIQNAALKREVYRIQGELRRLRGPRRTGGEEVPPLDDGSAPPAGA